MTSKLIRFRNARKTNHEGLTLAEWLAAAGEPEVSDETAAALVEAWENGEDPTDWRAARA